MGKGLELLLQFVEKEGGGDGGGAGVATSSNSGFFTPTHGGGRRKKNFFTIDKEFGTSISGQYKYYAEGKPRAVNAKEENDDELYKAVVQTPMKDGKFDSDAVETGNSVWITVTDPQSPLNGRPILITKRPDGLFAITGGSGFSTDARRHMVLTGTPRKTKRDEEIEEDIEEQKRNNETLKAARKEVTKEVEAEMKEVADRARKALGINEIDKKQVEEVQKNLQNYIAGMWNADNNDPEVKRLAKTIANSLVRTENKIRNRVQAEREKAVADVARLKEQQQQLESERRAQQPAGEIDEDFDDEIDQPEIEDRPVDEELRAIIEEMQEAMPREHKPKSIEMPDFGELADLTPQEQTSVINDHFENMMSRYFDDTDDDEGVEDDEEPPNNSLGINLGETIDKAPENIESAIDAVKSYYQKKREMQDISKKIKKVPMSKLQPATIEEIKSTSLEPVSLDEISEQANQELYRLTRNNSALQLYDAIGKHWNDDSSLLDRLDGGGYDTTMQFHVNGGAALALSAIGQDLLGVKYDVTGLIKNGNIEMAAAGLALAIKERTRYQEDYQQVVDHVRDFNTKNQQATEERALERHSKLSSQYDEIQRQKANAELLNKVQISNLERDNLMEQRTNLGAALGSLQASATFFDYLEKLGSASKSPVISVNVGKYGENARSIAQQLGVKSKDFVVDNDDPNNVKVHVALSGLMKKVKEGTNLINRNEGLNKIKTSQEGTSIDGRGNIVVDDFQVPGWKQSFVDDEGNTQDYRWRVEQRNDINWLNETTKRSADNPTGSGGGLITRTTGAGKTNTALGFYGFKLDENPKYKGLVVVPKGRAQQWVDEAKKFSDINVELIPDGTAKETVDSTLINSKPGTIYVVGHREASRSSEALHALQTDDELGEEKFHGITIDEPQELQARGASGNIGAMGRRIMKLPFKHRVGLTATPAKRSPLEAYDLIKWSNGSSGDLGSRASFRRVFSGFGSGTNAQDTAVNKLLYDSIQPYVSGDMITSPDFKVQHDSVNTNRSESQIARQQEIERGASEYVNTRRNELIQEANNNPNHPLRRSGGDNWESTLSRRAGDIARKEVQDQHLANMDGGDYNQNGKLMSLKQSIEADRDKKHVVFVDSKSQLQSLRQMFGDMGFGKNQVKNIAAAVDSIKGKDMSARAQAFQEDPNARVIIIDKASASGYNLQSGDALHVIGAPDSGATYLQSQGRVARMPRKGDVDIKTYRYSDNPTEAKHWNDIDSQLKVLQATSPAMFVGG